MERILVIADDLALNAGLCFELDTKGYISVAAYNCAKPGTYFQAKHFL